MGRVQRKASPFRLIVAKAPAALAATSSGDRPGSASARTSVSSYRSTITKAGGQSPGFDAAAAGPAMPVTASTPTVTRAQRMDVRTRTSVVSDLV